jgi:hypothetical protein
MTESAIVIRSVARQDGGFSVIARLERRGDTQVMVTTPRELVEGQRVRLNGAGMRWELAA